MRLLAIMLAALAVGSACLAQGEVAQPATPEDEIRALAERFMDRAMAGDAAALEEYLHENFVMIMPDELATRDEFLASTEAPPFEPRLGDYTPEIQGDVALVLIPAEIEQNMLPPSTHPRFMFVGAALRQNDAWRLVFAAVLVTIEPDGDAPNELILADQWLKQSFPTFKKTFASSRAEGRLSLDLFSDPGVLAGPWGEVGAMTALSGKEVTERAAELGALIGAPAVAADNPGEFEISGLGAGLFTRNVVVTTPDGPQLRRELVVCSFSQETMKWSVAAFLDLPAA